MKISSNVFKIELREQFSCNVFYLPELNALIDAGLSSKQELESELKLAGASLDSIEKVFLTHAHFDHAFNLKYLPNVELYAHELAIAKLKHDDDSTFFKETTGEKPLLPNKIVSFKGGEVFGEVKTFFTPGHCEEASCFLYEDYFFAGDTIFVNGLPRIFMQGGKELLSESYASLDKVNAKTVCCGHNQEGEFKKELERSRSELEYF
ncbi:MBL fold metallo-hydrolase [Candidatus Micrarchaeota archaeon]|nr:MBL fold metallo-hydrolase [Candidatus Micrarchaeota archaeon]